MHYGITNKYTCNVIRAAKLLYRFVYYTVLDKYANAKVALLHLNDAVS